MAPNTSVPYLPVNVAPTAAEKDRLAAVHVTAESKVTEVMAPLASVVMPVTVLVVVPSVTVIPALTAPVIADKLTVVELATLVLCKADTLYVPVLASIAAPKPKYLFVPVDEKTMP